MNNFSFATWNVNSIRSRVNQFNSIMKEHSLDIIMLQETKTQDKDFPKFIFDDLNYNVLFHGQKSYNGVAIASKYPIYLESNKLSRYNIEENEDEEARYIEASTTINSKFYTIINVYIPMGDSEEMAELENKKRFKYKINFYKRLQRRLSEFKKDENVIIGGDFNVAKDEIDLAFPKRNEGGIGFHPIERKEIKKIEELGFVDLYRAKNPNKIEYSWWDYRTKAFDRNSGWRLDYLFSSKNILENIIEVKILTEARGMEKASDHTLVIAKSKI